MKKIAVCFLATLLAQGVQAEAPANMEEMWKIIQQQQKEIEALKNKLEHQEPAKPAVAEAKTPAVKTDAERKTDILAAEVDKLKSALVIPDKREYKSQYGLGPAASQVYSVGKGLSIGGYGEAKYTNFVQNKGTNKDQIDLMRAVLYAGYKFNDWIILNNEIEFEHATTKEDGAGKASGEVSVEFSQLDFLLHKNANIRTGLMLMPMGFINEMHEPTTFHGSNRPDVERYIIPATWREMGAGLFGEVLPGLQYRMYAVNGLNATKFSKGGIRDGRQGGARALADNFAFTGRLDYSPDFIPGFLVGASAYLGNSGQSNFVKADGRSADVFTQLYEGHVQWHYKGFEFRTLGAFGHVGDAALASTVNKTTVGSENFGWYTEAAYDVMPLLWKNSTQYLAPFFRYERYDTLARVPAGFLDDGFYDRRIYQGGLTYKPIPNIAIKADYRNIQSRSGVQPHEINLGVGFMY